MTVKIREWKKTKQMGFEVDIRIRYPDGASLRRRVKAPVDSRSAAKRWGEAMEPRALGAAITRDPAEAAGRTKRGADTE